MTEETQTDVLYNGACPVCAAEIGHYQGYAGARALPIRFHDLNATDLARWGLTPDQAARRLYVARNGRLESGIPAFLTLWRDMPRYRWLARLVGLPGVRQAAAALYDHVLAPLLYRWHLRRQRRLSL